MNEKKLNVAKEILIALIQAQVDGYINGSPKPSDIPALAEVAAEAANRLFKMTDCE